MRSRDSSGNSSRFGVTSPTLTKKFQAILPLAEQLCCFEETVVREAASQSLIEMAEKLPEEDVVSVIVPCVLRLSEGVSFTHKVAAINIMGSIYEKSGEHKTTLRK